MRKAGTDREKNNVVASVLLPLLEAEPRGWEAMTSINLGKREHQKSLAQHIAEWRQNMRAELRPFVESLARIFDIKL